MSEENLQAELIRRLQHRCDMEAAHIAELKDQISGLRALLAVALEQRDEARREVCKWLVTAEGGTEQEHATEAGWDCCPEPPLDRLAKLDEECGLQ